MLTYTQISESKKILGGWSPTLNSYHQLNSLEAVCTVKINQINELLRTVVCFGAPIDCFDTGKQILLDKLEEVQTKRDYIKNLLQPHGNKLQ